MHVRFRPLVAAAIAAGLAVAACSNDPETATTEPPATGGDSAPDATTGATTGGSAGSTPGSAPATAGGSSPTTAAPSPDGIVYNEAKFDGTPQDGGSITIAIESAVTTLDPASSLVQSGDGLIARAVYDTLLQFTPEGDTAPMLATEVTSDDLTTWTITLRDDVEFHDGTPFDADAVVAAMQRRKDSADFPGAATMATVESFVAESPTSVVVTLTAPNVTFPSFLASFAVESPTAVAEFGADYPRNPVGTGPFRMVDYDALRLEANEDYWRTDDDGGTLPYLDELRFEALPDSTTRLQSLQSGTVDMIQTADSNNLVEAADGGELDVQWISGSSSLIVVQNSSAPPFDDRRLREAVALAVDRDQINEVVYNGARRPSYSRLLPESPWYHAAGDAPAFDLAAATALVDELEAEGKPTSFRLDCVPTPEFTAVTQLLEQQLEAAGMTVELNAEEQSAYVERIFSKAGDYEMACLRGSQVVDPDGLYNALYTDGGVNVTFFSDPTVDANLDAARATDDEAEREALYDEVQEIAGQSLVTIPILFNVFGFVYQPGVSGLPAPDPFSLGVINPATLYLEA